MTIVQANQRRLSYCLNIQEIPIFLIDEKETVGMLKGSEYDFQFYKQPTRYVVRTLVDTVITMR